MASNKALEYQAPLQFPVPVTAASGSTPASSPITSGAPVVLRGTAGQSYLGVPTGVPMVANESPVSPTGAVAPGNMCSFDAWGAYNLTVTAEIGESPVVNQAIKPGDQLFANINTGTYDATTGIFYGFTIDKNQSGVPFGWAVDAVASGLTATIRVMLRSAVQG
jgi:hypothetical protein